MFQRKSRFRAAFSLDLAPCRTAPCARHPTRYFEKTDALDPSEKVNIGQEFFMSLLLVAVFAVLFPLTHWANGWLFAFAEINPNVGLVYLPAFWRLANILILGPVKGTAATLLGGAILAPSFDDPSWATALNVVCSACGPLVALFAFKAYFKRSFELTSLKDLAVLTLIYAMANAFLHHFMWAALRPSQLGSPEQILWMVIGDILGALIGAYLLKWGVTLYRRRQVSQSMMD